MVSFPNEYYCSCNIGTPDPDWMTAENMSYCDQPDSSNEMNLIGEIKHFFLSLF